MLQSTHVDTVKKINFVLALVECIVEIANVKSSLISQSLTSHDFVHVVKTPPSSPSEPTPPSNRIVTSADLSLEEELARSSDAARVACADEDVALRDLRLEELVLVVRALQLLGATIQLTNEELHSKRLQATSSVRTSESHIDDVTA